jgi:hypothetical protein
LPPPSCNLRTLRRVPGSAYPAVRTRQCVPGSAYPAVRTRQCVPGSQPTRRRPRSDPAPPSLVRGWTGPAETKAAKWPWSAPLCSLFPRPPATRKGCHGPGHPRLSWPPGRPGALPRPVCAYPALRTRQCVPCSNSTRTRKKKILRPPRRRHPRPRPPSQPSPPPPRPCRGASPSRGGQRARRPPGGRSRGGASPEPRHPCRCPDPKASPPAPRVPRSPARALDPAKSPGFPS